MDEEKNKDEQSEVKEEEKSGGKSTLNKFAQGLKSKLIKWLPTILPVIVAILAVVVILGVINLIIDTFLSLLGFYSPTQSADTNTSEINQTASIIYIDEDSGAYKLHDNFSEKLLEALENSSIDAEAAGFIAEDLEDMLNKYIKAEVQTMFPKTGLLGNDVDGLITIQRASTDRNNKNIRI